MKRDEENLCILSILLIIKTVLDILSEALYKQNLRVQGHIYVIHMCYLRLMGMDARSQDYSFLCCCDLEFKGTWSYIFVNFV